MGVSFPLACLQVFRGAGYPLPRDLHTTFPPNRPPSLITSQHVTAPPYPPAFINHVNEPHPLKRATLCSTNLITTQHSQRIWQELSHNDAQYSWPEKPRFKIESFSDTYWIWYCWVRVVLGFLIEMVGHDQLLRRYDALLLASKIDLFQKFFYFCKKYKVNLIFQL